MNLSAKRSLQGVMRGHRRIIHAVRRSMQFPNAANAPRTPLHRSAKQYVAKKIVRLQEGILNVQTPKFPFFKALSDIT